MARREIDPQLPYLQIHRSVLQRATTLCTIYKLPMPHVVGALVTFWMDLSDRRILRKALDAGVFVLVEGELKARLRSAFGQDMEPGDFVIAGLLEPVDASSYRVRGMSEPMAVEAKRLRLARIPFGPNHQKVVPEAGPSKEKEASVSPTEVEKAFQAPPPEKRANPRRELSDLLVEDYAKTRGEKYLWASGRDGTAFTELFKTFPPELIRARWLKGLKAVGWNRISNLGQLLSRWNELADDAPVPIQGRPGQVQEKLKVYGPNDDPYATPAKVSK